MTAGVELRTLPSAVQSSVHCSSGSAPHRIPGGTAAAAGRAAAGEQRLDFVLLLQIARVVVEVDSRQHDSDGQRSDPARYAAVVAEDRARRLAG